MEPVGGSDGDLGVDLVINDSPTLLDLTHRFKEETTQASLERQWEEWEGDTGAGHMEAGSAAGEDGGAGDEGMT